MLGKANSGFNLGTATANGILAVPYPKGIVFMGLLRWFTKNWANTTEPTHADLAPLDLLGVDVAGALAKVDGVVRTLPNWTVESGDATAGKLHLTRKTGTVRFVDDIRLTLQKTATGVQGHAESRSRVGTVVLLGKRERESGITKPRPILRLRPG